MSADGRSGQRGRLRPGAMAAMRQVQHQRQGVDQGDEFFAQVCQARVALLAAAVAQCVGRGVGQAQEPEPHPGHGFEAPELVLGLDHAGTLGADHDSEFPLFLGGEHVVGRLAQHEKRTVLDLGQVALEVLHRLVPVLLQREGHVGGVDAPFNRPPGIFLIEDVGNRQPIEDEVAVVETARLFVGEERIWVGSHCHVIAPGGCGGLLRKWPAPRWTRVSWGSSAR